MCYTHAVNTSFPHVAIALMLLATPCVLAQSPANELILSEDFEKTAVGEIPQGFTKQGAVAVVQISQRCGAKTGDWLKIPQPRDGNVVVQLMNLRK